MLVAALLGVAGSSETAGRILPLTARRRGGSLLVLAALFAASTVVEALCFAAWPMLAGLLLGLGSGTPVAGAHWTAEGVAVLALAGVLAFPLLGPALHAAVIVAAALALTRQLALDAPFWPAAGAVAGAGALLCGAVYLIRSAVGLRARREPRAQAAGS